MIRFTCSACQMVLQAPDDRVGVMVACPRCKGQLRVPRLAAASAVALAPASASASPPWYYIHDQAKRGPVAFAQLQELALTGRLAAGDMVWRDGMAQWTQASSVDGLCPRQAPPAEVQGKGAVPVAPKTHPDAPPGTTPRPTSLWQRVQGVLDQFKNVLANLKDIKAGVLALVPSLPFLAGFVGDFLRPLAPFNFLFFLLALLVTLALIGFFLRFPRLLTFRAGAACLACAVVCLIFGLWWGLALFGGSGDKGFLASNVGFVHYIQAAVVTRGENSVATDTTVKGDALADEVLREMQAEKDGEKLVAYALGGYPANVLKAEPVGDPKRRKGEKDEIVLEYDLRIGVDQEQYDRIVEKKILPVLEKAATLKGESFSGARAAADNQGWGSRMLRTPFGNGSEDFRFSKVFQFDKNELGGEWRQGEMDAQTDMCVVVNSSRSSTDDKLTWKWFHEPKAPVYNWNGRGTGVKVNVFFRDKDGKELSRDQIEIEGRSVPGVQLTDAIVGRANIDELVLSPYLLYQEFYARTLTTTQEVHFTAADLAKFAGIHCTVEPGAAP